jgi:hypothetical protein
MKAYRTAKGRVVVFRPDEVRYGLGTCSNVYERKDYYLSGAAHRNFQSYGLDFWG